MIELNVEGAPQICPRCKVNRFDKTGGYPRFGPLQCQACAAEDWIKEQGL